MNLGDFLFDAANSRAPWNCSTMPADWCIALGHPDFAKNWRWITNARRCERIARRGLLRLWWRGIGDSLPMIDDFRAGDIGVIRRAGLEAGAIFDGEFWVLQSQRGIACLRADRSAVLAAWRPT